ncbi:MAG TPA: hypothetical protein VFP05_08440 [Thermomicrobiales bacterium]|jgi:hypothetical protein|nr:hypothetical protein [Thermomicrobiales bacterium]
MKSQLTQQRFAQPTHDPAGGETMIEMAPIQMFVFGFHDAEQFTPAIIREVEALQKRGLIRLIDLLYVERLPDGSLVTNEMSGLSPREVEEFGGLLETLLSASGESAGSGDHSESSHQDADADLFYGLAMEDMTGVIEDIPPGGAAAVALFEHSWAFDIRNKIRRATGYPIAQGFLTPELFMLVGEEVRLMHEAAAAVQIAREVRGAALLDALDSIVGSATGDEALVASTAEILQSGSRQSVASAAATVRALIEGGFLQDASAEEAIKYLVRKDIIDAESLSEAERLVDNVNPN